MSEHILFISTLTLLGWLIGGSLGWILSILLHKQLNNLYIIACGILVGVIFFKLIPEAVEHYNVIGLIIGVLAGLSLLLLLEGRIIELHRITQQIPRAYLSSLILVIGIVIHNIPAGITIGSELDGITGTSSTLLAAFVLHQIPEGIALFISFLSWTDSVSPFLFSLFALSVIILLSISIGYYFVDVPLKSKAILIGTAIGTIGFASFHSISNQHNNNIYIYRYFLLGIALVLIYTILFISHGRPL